MITPSDVTAALTIAAAGAAGAVAAGVVYWLFFTAPNMSEGYGPMREINVNGTAPTDEGWKQAQREACPPGSICVPSRDNLITGSYTVGICHATLEQAASVRATSDGIDHGAEGSSLDDSRRELSAEDAALLLGIGQEYRASLAAGDAAALPSGDDYVDGIVVDVSDRTEQHW